MGTITASEEVASSSSSGASAALPKESPEWTGALLRGLESGKRMHLHPLQTVGPALTAVSFAYDTYHLGCAVASDYGTHQRLREEINKLEKVVRKIEERCDKSELSYDEKKKAEEAGQRYRRELELLRRCLTKVPTNTIRASGSIAGGWAAGLAGGSTGAWAGSHTGAALGALCAGLPGAVMGTVAGAVIGALGGGVAGGTVGSATGELVAEKGLETLVGPKLEPEVALDATEWVDIQEETDLFEMLDDGEEDLLKILF